MKYSEDWKKLLIDEKGPAKKGGKKFAEKSNKV